MKARSVIATCLVAGVILNKGLDRDKDGIAREKH